MFSLREERTTVISCPAAGSTCRPIRSCQVLDFCFDAVSRADRSAFRVGQNHYGAVGGINE